MFKGDIKVRLGERIDRDGFSFIDLGPSA